MKIDIFNTDKKYDIIYADPPWRYQDKKCNGNAAEHYDCMSIEDICSLPVKKLASDNCVLLLWTTYPMMQEAMKLIEAWGFKYKTIGFQWVKRNRGGKRIVLRSWQMDARKHRTLPDCRKGQAA